MAEGSAGGFDQTLDMFLDAFGNLGGVVLEVFEENALLTEEAFQAAGIAERQVSAEDDAVEARQDAGDGRLVLAKERMFECNSRHGVFLWLWGCWLIPPLSGRKTPFASLSLVAAKLR